MNWKLWIKAAAIRTIKTMAEAALSMLTIGQLFFEIDWLGILSVSLTAGVYAFLTCIKGLPEVETQGAITFTPDEWEDE